ncbi:MAG: hypothetical protein Roseis2KO_00380 [Roseivirga sp.]
MRILYTEQALNSLEEAMHFLIYKQKLPEAKVQSIKNRVLDAADNLKQNPYGNQLEPRLSKLQMGHRRLVSGHFKIIYWIQGDTIFIADFFDSRQDPEKMKY